MGEREGVRCSSTFMVKKKEKKIVNENIIYTADLRTLVYVIIIIILLLFDKWLHPTKIIQRSLLRSA